MIVSFMLYSLVIGTLVAIAARLGESSLANLGGARRVPWLLGIAATLALPLIATSLSEPVRPVFVASSVLMAPHELGAESAAPPAPASEWRGVRVGRWSVSQAAGAIWGAASAVSLMLLGLGAWRLARRARGWRVSSLDACDISIAPDLGPAVYGWRAPRVVFPAWLLEAPSATRDLALAHERAHLAARDPQLLAFATVMATLLPWNLPLLYMLRRLRFAMEVDCDSRVLRAGADAAEYGAALLYVSVRQARAPVAALALIERSSQLERRIQIMFTSNRRPALAAGLAALALSCIVAAAQVDAPRRSGAMLKPPPNGAAAMELGRRFETHLHQQYPEFFDRAIVGRPMIVALLDDHGQVVRSAKTWIDEPRNQVTLNFELFGILGLSTDEVPYAAEMDMQMAPGSDKVVKVVYTERRMPGERFHSRVFPDTRAVDREIFLSNFPQTKTSFQANSFPWVLLDRDGEVLRSGLMPADAGGDSGKFDAYVEAQLPGVATRTVTLTPLEDENGKPYLDAAGHELQLWSLWLAPEPSN